ncbi:MAG TPA: hypothetical protein PLB59_12280 [Bacteroidales bacterium]|nr:hypothetical protein [Bacteroidales bacterium]HPB26411.1 hypothetical protein [Bacteroidales bacterium]HPI30875.1 hypothetical protein [Bacteroidales bacterium]HQN17161.1 hypothetical protein [Bacteroidales bacterium]HQP16732.1 hypothetical protein [Bacteroidales bacterium]
MSNKNDANEKDIKLTIEEIKKHKEFESLTDEELDILADNIYQCSSIIFEYYENQ